MIPLSLGSSTAIVQSLTGRSVSALSIHVICRSRILRASTLRCCHQGFIAFATCLLRIPCTCHGRLASTKHPLHVYSQLWNRIMLDHYAFCAGGVAHAASVQSHPLQRVQEQAHGSRSSASSSPRRAEVTAACDLLHGAAVTPGGTSCDLRTPMSASTDTRVRRSVSVAGRFPIQSAPSVGHHTSQSAFCSCFGVCHICTAIGAGVQTAPPVGVGSKLHPKPRRPWVSHTSHCMGRMQWDPEPLLLQHAAIEFNL